MTEEFDEKLIRMEMETSKYINGDLGDPAVADDADNDLEQKQVVRLKKLDMTKKNIAEVVKRLGGEVKGNVEVESGYFGAIALDAEIRRRFRKPKNGGRSTDPEWTKYCLIRLKPETFQRLEEIAEELSTSIKVSPIQFATLLLEFAVENNKIIIANK
jgi:hypothetical protein